MTPLQITLLAIGGLILLLIFLVLLGTVKIRISCRDKLKVVLSVVGIRFTLYPDKQDKEAEKDLSRCRNPERMLKRELRRREREAKKALKKAYKKQLKAQKRKLEKQQRKATQPTPNLKENLGMITELVKKIYRITNGKLEIRVHKLLVSVGTDDAAKTAILYGATVQSVGYLIELIDSKFAKVKRNAKDMEVVADYTSGKCHAEIDISCAVEIPRAIGLAIKIYNTYKKEQAKTLKKAKLRLQSQKKAV